MASTSQSATARQIDDQSGDSEPSMEEILASIRQIISEDETPDDGLSERERYTHPSDPSNANIPLTEATLSAGNSTAAPAREPTVQERASKVRAELAARHEASQADSGVKLKTQALAEKFEQENREPRPKPLDDTSSMLAAAPPIPRFVAPTQVAPVPAATAPNVVVEQMAATLMREKGAEIDAMLGEMMRPIVRKWLGDNLPTLVERLVRDEIERVSRGRQGG